MNVEIKPIGFDDFGREIFITKKGTFLVLVDNDFYTKAPNEFDGEPCFKIKKDSLIIVTEFSNKNNNES